MFKGEKMQPGIFYFINDDYFQKFKENNLMDNKEAINGQPHNRPCYYSFKETVGDIIWMIPISSKVEKYEIIYNERILKYPDYDGIRFGYVLGEKRAFLIQNLCPVTAKYITEEYIDKATNSPVDIPDDLKKDLNARARKAIRLYRKGIKIVFPNILDIEQALLDELST
jgi:hypothetical protein